MQQFLEELSKASYSVYDEMPVSTDAEKKYEELREKYTKLIGHRAMFVDKILKDSRVVVIKEVRDRYLVLSYKYHGMGYEGTITTTVNYGALLCGEGRLDIE